MVPLPEELEITKACISRLHITVPVAFHNTGIVFDIKGIDIRARFSHTIDEQSKTGHESIPRTDKKTQGTRKRASFGVSPEDKLHLPSAEELAESFLAEEPAEELQELEAAIHSQLDDSGSEEEDVGTGAGFSLPFVANFFKGIADRLRATISDVKLTVDIELIDSSVVSHCFRIGSVEVEGLTLGAEDSRGSTTETSEAGESTWKKRRIRLLQLSSDLITDPDTFTSMDRVSSTHSPLTTHSPSTTYSPTTTHSPVATSSTSSLHRSHISTSNQDRGSPHPAASTFAGQNFVLDLEHSSSHQEREDLTDSRYGASLFQQFSTVSPPLTGNFAGADGERFADASDDEDDDDDGRARSQHSLLDRSRPFLDSSDSELLEHDFPFAMEDHDMSTCEGMDEHELYASPSASLVLPASAPGPKPSRSSVSRGRQSLSATTPLNPAPRHNQSFTGRSLPLSSSQPSPTHGAYSTVANVPMYDRRTSSPSPARSSSSGDSSGSQPQSGDEDLSASRIFSHEEAESMYLSALSEASPKQSTRLSMPGGWDRSSLSSEGSQPFPEKEIHSYDSHPLTTDREDTGFETPRPGTPAISTPQLQSEGLTSSSFEESSNALPFRTNEQSERVSKRLLTVDEISILVPWQSEPTEDESNTDLIHEDLAMSMVEDYSAYEGMPGAFSQHDARSGKGRWPTNPVPPQNPQRPTEDSKPLSRPKATSIEVELGSVISHIDISGGRLLSATFQQVLRTWNHQSSDIPQSVPNQDDATPTAQTVKLTVQKVALSFVEQMPFVSIKLDESAVRTPPASLDALFTLAINETTLLLQTIGSTMKTTLDLHTMQFGSPHAQILSFTRTPNPDQRRRSDISATFSNESPRGPELTIKTLPLLLSLDMHKLDDQLSCFGGLSGVLDLSSSIASISTVHAASPVVRGKNVHFDAPVSVAGNSLCPIKVNAKIDGMIFNLHGKACGVTLENSAVRLVVRDTYASLQINHIKFTGPFENNERTEIPLTVDVTGTKFIFLLSPEEDDLTQLVDLITPSRDRYEDDDDILLDTLLRQRKKGSLLRVLISDVAANIDTIEKIQGFRLLSDEISKLSTVAKYLPEDDRPGLLTIAKVESIAIQAWVNDSVGTLNAKCTHFNAAHVGLPALLALEVGTVGVRREEDEELVGSLLQLQPVDRLPMVMARVIGDELEPTIKVKLFNLAVEYRVPTVMAILGLPNLTASMTRSVVTIRDRLDEGGLDRQKSANTGTSSGIQPFHVDLLLRDCALGLNPGEIPSKAVVLLKNARLIANTSAKEDFNTKFEIRKASILLVDDTRNLNLGVQPALRSRSSQTITPTEADLGRQGFKSVASISNAEAIIQAKQSNSDNAILAVVLAVQIFILESCADSTQTLIEVLSGLAPSMPPQDTSEQYRTNIVPFTDMMASITGQAFPQPESDEDDALDMVDADQLMEDLPANYEFVGSFFEPELNVDDGDEQLLSPVSHDSRRSTRSSYYAPKGHFSFTKDVEDTFEHNQPNTRLEFCENFLARMKAKAPVRRWHPNTNKFLSINQSELENCPIRVKVRVKSLIWNLHDGYDWSKTRDTISRAVEEIEARAEKRRREREGVSPDDDEQGSEIGDFLFQSIWIAVPPNRDEHDLRRQINRDLDDLTSETATVTTATESHLGGRPLRSRKPRKLRLGRSSSPKMCFDLSGVALDMLSLPPASETTQNSVMVKIQDMNILDALPTSTWNKFMGYMHDAGEPPREKPMIRLEIVNVRPVPDLAASELVIKVSSLVMK
jgi:autophagy-related protein 2